MSIHGAYLYYAKGSFHVAFTFPHMSRSNKRQIENVSSSDEPIESSPLKRQRAAIRSIGTSLHGLSLGKHTSL